ncbi:MAG: VWA domain-containing protein [Sandaracinaceae bacterium]|nr:VWA domain-containing protein [Sandaracinaceae bacterium]
MRRTWIGLVVLWPLVVSSAVSSAQAQTVTAALRLRAQLEVRDPERPAERLGPLPLVEERVRATIEGQHATTELVQVFHNRSGARLEGQYVLRPSIDARVQGFAYYVGEERIVGEILERQSARQVYDQVTRVRRDPAILEQTGDGEFTFRVFPIEPAENKRVETTFAEWLSRRGSQVTYRVPAGASASAEILLRDLRARDVRSPTHDLDVERVAGGVRVRARNARASANGELVLRWDVGDASWQPTAYVHRDAGQDGYFLLTLAAPEGLEDQIADKDVTLVLDRSGSMAGEAIVNARLAAIDVLRRLAPGDRVNVIAFDDDVDPLYARPRALARGVREEAIRYVSELRAGGGTDIAFALSRAFASQHDGEGRPRVVIFMTDGQSDATAALAAAAREQRDVRVFTVGLGQGVNRALLSRLAAEKRGTSTFIDRASSIERDVGHLYAQIARPLLVDVSVEVEGGVASRIYPRSVPDVFVDDELVIVGRYRGDARAVRFVVRGTLADRPLSVDVTASAGAPAPWVGRRWAIARTDHLLEQIALEGERPELRSEVTSLALAYRFVTPYTAFLAIPERELTAEAARTLADGRAVRDAAQEQHADARSITSGGEALAQRSAMPAAEEELDAEPGDAWSGGGGDAVHAVETLGMAPPSADRAGCASCAVGAERDAPRAPWLALAALGLFLWRRRRAR